MKYQWLEEDITCSKLSQELGINVKSIMIGKLSPEDIAKCGVEIDFEGTPTAKQLTMLRAKFPKPKRSGDKNFFDAVQSNLDLEGTQKVAFKTSQLYGLTQEQLQNYIDNNVTNLAQAKDFIKKLSAVVLWLVKQTKLDE